MADKISRVAPGTGSKSRDAIADYSLRERRLRDLLAMPAMPIADVAIYLDIPLSTLDKLRAQGRGPKLFRLGRRLYCLQADLHAWLERMAADEVE